MPDSLPEQDSPGDKRPADRAIGHRPQKETDVGDFTDAVNPNRDRIDIDHRNPPANGFQIAVAQPGHVSFELGKVAHEISFALLAARPADRQEMSGTAFAPGVRHSLG